MATVWHKAQNITKIRIENSKIKSIGSGCGLGLCHRGECVGHRIEMYVVILH